MSFKIDILVLSIIGLNFTPKILENTVECYHARIHKQGIQNAQYNFNVTTITVLEALINLKVQNVIKDNKNIAQFKKKA